MTDRIPLIVNSVDSQIQELPAADNLNLANSNIVGVIGITASGNATVDAIFTDNYYYANGSPFVSGISLSDISVTSASPSGNGSLTYNNTTGVLTFTPSAPQALTWDANTTTLSLSSGNSVDLSVLQNSNYGNTEVQAYLDAQGYSNVDNDAQSISIAGNVISISGNASTVDLTTALSTVAGNYGDANVRALGEAGWAGNIIPNSNEVYDLGTSSNRWRDIYLSGNTIDLGGTAITRLANGAISFGNNVVKGGPSNSPFLTDDEFTTANAEMQAYVDNQINLIKGGANVNLDSLAEVANALNNSNTQLSTVAFTGTFGDLQSIPTLQLSSSNLTFNGTTVDLSGVGAVGPQGNAGADGVSVSSADATSGNLLITLSNTSVIDAGNVQGPQGIQGNVGPQGDGNAGISSATITSSNLIITLNDSTTIDAGNVEGPQGATGDTGVGITSVSLVGGNLQLTYSNTSTQDVGNVQGPAGSNGVDGSNGSDGVSVSTATVNGSGNLILTLSNASTIDAGNVKGSDGAAGDVDQTLSLVGNVITISGSGSNVDLTTALGSVTSDYGDSNVASFLSSNSYSNVAYGNTEVQAYLDAQGYSNVDSDAQTLSISGNVITISGSNSNVDLTTALGNVSGGGGSSSFDIAGNTGTHTFDGSAETLVFSGTTGQINAAVATNYVTFELANTGVTAGTYGSTTQAPRITVDAQGRITSVTNQTISGGGGGGSGTAYEYFKIYYTGAGAIDTTQGSGGYSNVSSNIGNVTINNAASNSCEVIVDFGGNYSTPPLNVLAYGFAAATSEYNIKNMSSGTVNTTLKMAGSGSPHDALGSANITMSLTRGETGSSAAFGAVTHAWIYFVMGS